MISNLKVYKCRSMIYEERHFYFVFIAVRDLAVHPIFVVRIVPLSALVNEIHWPRGRVALVQNVKAETLRSCQPC